MTDNAILTNPGGRDNNEDYVKRAAFGDDMCYILCDGLGGHECGEVASSEVAEYVAKMFSEKGDYPEFLDDAFNGAQQMLLSLQEERHMQNAMKTTLVVLSVTKEHIKCAHIADSRLYHIYNNGESYERTRDHSMVQLLVDMGEIQEKDIRTHEDRNKVLRVMGAEWSTKSYDKSGVLERNGSPHAFALMTDGFWEYVYEEEMLRLQKEAATCEEWLKGMQLYVRERADMTRTDNYSAICVRVS